MNQWKIKHKPISRLKVHRVADKNMLWLCIHPPQANGTTVPTYSAMGETRAVTTYNKFNHKGVWKHSA